MLRNSIDDLIASNSEQPSSKASAFLIGLPSIDGFGDCNEDILCDFSGISLLQSTPSGKTEQQRLVNLNKLAPRLSVRLRREAKD
jgi:hypothetical protein